MKGLPCFLLLALIACTSAKHDEANRPVGGTAATTEFLSFISMLPKVHLPFEVNCEKCCPHADLDYENELLKKFQPEGSAIVGLLGKTNKHFLVLVTYAGDMRIPSIVVFDVDGNVVGEKNFMTRYCGGDEDFYSSQFLRKNGDLTINTRDTAFNVKRDTVQYNVIDTTSIEVDVRNFFINDDGVILQTDSVINKAN